VRGSLPRHATRTSARAYQSFATVLMATRLSYSCLVRCCFSFLHHIAGLLLERAAARQQKISVCLRWGNPLGVGRATARRKTCSLAVWGLAGGCPGRACGLPLPFSDGPYPAVSSPTSCAFARGGITGGFLFFWPSSLVIKLLFSVSPALGRFPPNLDTCLRSARASGRRARRRPNCTPDCALHVLSPPRSLRAHFGN